MTPSDIISDVDATIVRRPTVREIQLTVAAAFGIPLIEMESARRGRSVARPRQIAMYLSRELTLLSLPQIGRRFGNRDHTTIMHGITVVEKAIAEGDYWGAEAVRLRAEISDKQALQRAA